MNIKKEDILKVVQEKGPMIPLDIKRALQKGDSMIIGALLSQLINIGEIKFTNVKMGSSPFYYVKGQEQKLSALSQYLNEKDKRVFNKLKEKKILRDKELEPLERVGCRTIVDFSKKLVVSIGGEKEIFWKYFLLTDQEGIEAIKEQLRPRSEQSQKEPEPVKKESVASQEPKPKQKTLQDSEDKSEFETRIMNYFNNQNIKVIERNVIRKNADYEFMIRLNTALGETEFFCKARNKKKISDGDISEAYLESLIKRSPVVFVTFGEVAKKAKEKIKTHYKGMIIKEIK